MSSWSLPVCVSLSLFFFFFQAEDGIRDLIVTGVQTCALPILLGVLEKWQKKGVRFDYFTLDTGWVDPNSDLTRFRPTCYPNGPGKIVARVKDRKSVV